MLRATTPDPHAHSILVFRVRGKASVGNARSSVRRLAWPLYSVSRWIIAAGTGGRAYGEQREYPLTTSSSAKLHRQRPWQVRLI